MKKSDLHILLATVWFNGSNNGNDTLEALRVFAVAALFLSSIYFLKRGE